jgi:hypothetical protein
MAVTILTVFYDSDIEFFQSLTVKKICLSTSDSVKIALEAKLRGLDPPITHTCGTDNYCAPNRPVDLHLLLSFLEQQAGRLQYSSHPNDRNTMFVFAWYGNRMNYRNAWNWKTNNQYNFKKGNILSIYNRWNRVAHHTSSCQISCFVWCGRRYKSTRWLAHGVFCLFAIN